jgi:hypothetical protein
MIFLWVAKIWVFFKVLFAIPKPMDVKRLNRDLKCPVCGGERGRLRCVTREQLVQGRPVTPMTLCEHTCLECGARFYERPVAEVNPSFVFQAVPRNRLERLADEADANEKFRQLERSQAN